MPTGKKLLVVADSGAPFAAVLVAGGFVVEECPGGPAAVARAICGGHDLVVLDCAAAGGIEAIGRLRRAGSAVPVLVIGDTRALEVAALDAGADGAVARPVAADELVARVAGMLRRCGAPGAAPRVAACGDLEVDADAGLARAGGRPLALTPRQMQILAVLMRRFGTPVCRQTLLDQLYTGIDVPAPATIDVFVHGIRQQLRRAGSACSIHTVRGIGFCLATGG